VRVSKNLRRSMAVTLAGVTMVGAAALPASAAVGSARPATAIHATAASRQVRLDLAVRPFPSTVTAVLVRNASTGAVIGVFTVRAGVVTHLTVTVAPGVTLDISALTAANANRPAGLGTVRVVVGQPPSASAENTVSVAFRSGAKPTAALASGLSRQGSRVSVR
jgi:hypothetical protein